MSNRAILMDVEDTLFTNGRLYPDTIAFLESCHNTGIRMVAFTNGGRDSTKDILERHKIADLFEFVFSCPDYSMAKPDPRAVNVVRTLLRDEHSFRVSKENMFLVGDRPDVDIVCGNRAGITTIRVKRGGFSHVEPEYDDEKALHNVPDFREAAKILNIEMAAKAKTGAGKAGSKKEPKEEKQREVDADYLFR